MSSAPAIVLRRGMPKRAWSRMVLPRDGRTPTLGELKQYRLTPRLWNVLRIILVDCQHGVPEYSVEELCSDLFAVSRLQVGRTIDDLCQLGVAERGYMLGDTQRWFSGTAYGGVEQRVRFVPEDPAKPFGPPAGGVA